MQNLTFSDELSGWDKGISWNNELRHVASPTADNETMLQSTQRVARDLYIGASSHAGAPNGATVAEAKDLIIVDPTVKTYFNTATNNGLDVRQAHEDPIQAMIEVLGGAPAATPADVNPRYVQFAQTRLGDESEEDED